VDWASRGYQGPTQSYGTSDDPGSGRVTDEFANFLNENGYTQGQAPGDQNSRDGYSGLLDSSGNLVPGTEWANDYDDSAFWNMAMLAAGIATGGAATAAGLGPVATGALSGGVTGFMREGDLGDAFTGAATGALGGGLGNIANTGNAVADAAINNAVRSGATATLQGKDLDEVLASAGSGALSGGISAGVGEAGLPTELQRPVSGALTSAALGQPINYNQLVQGLIKYGMSPSTNTLPDDLGYMMGPPEDFSNLPETPGPIEIPTFPDLPELGPEVPALQDAYPEAYYEPDPYMAEPAFAAEPAPEPAPAPAPEPALAAAPEATPTSTPAPVPDPVAAYLNSGMSDLSSPNGQGGYAYGIENPSEILGMFEPDTYANPSDQSAAEQQIEVTRQREQPSDDGTTAGIQDIIDSMTAMDDGTTAGIQDIIDNASSPAPSPAPAPAPSPALRPAPSPAPAPAPAPSNSGLDILSLLGILGLGQQEQPQVQDIIANPNTRLVIPGSDKNTGSLPYNYGGLIDYLNGKG
jgi:hypothetical protein